MAGRSATTPGLTPEMVATMLLSAARQHRRGDRARSRLAAGLLTDRCAGQPDLIEAAVRIAVPPSVGAAWTLGWSPADLYQLARRRLDEQGVDYLVDAIAGEARRHAPAGLHERWREQLRRLGAQVWWDPAQDHLGQWIRRRHGHLVDALATVIAVLALLISLPKLPTIRPSPAGTALPDGVDQKVLAKVRGLLAKAESTTFPDEAEALSAKAQELVTRYALQRVVAQSEDGSGPRPGSARRMWLDNPYVAAKALLVDAVAEANRCRAVLSEKLGFITVLGDEVDLELVELISTSLLVQATRAMVCAGSRTSRTGQSRTRSFRHAFLIAYATRIRERLTAARDTSTTAAGDPDRLLPVLAAKEQAVDELLASMFPVQASRSFSVGNAAGWSAGRAAAELAVLENRRAVGPGPGQNMPAPGPSR